MKKNLQAMSFLIWLPFLAACGEVSFDASEQEPEREASYKYTCINPLSRFLGHWEAVIINREDPDNGYLEGVELEITRSDKTKYDQREKNNISAFANEKLLGTTAFWPRTAGEKGDYILGVPSIPGTSFPISAGDYFMYVSTNANPINERFAPWACPETGDKLWFHPVKYSSALDHSHGQQSFCFEKK